VEPHFVLLKTSPTTISSAISPDAQIKCYYKAMLKVSAKFRKYFIMGICFLGGDMINPHQQTAFFPVGRAFLFFIQATPL
jgi:hypothetical protein